MTVWPLVDGANPSAGSAPSRTISRVSMPSARAPSQYAVWSSTKTASAGSALERRQAPRR